MLLLLPSNRCAKGPVKRMMRFLQYHSLSYLQEYWYSLKYAIMMLTVFNLAFRVMRVSRQYMFCFDQRWYWAWEALMCSILHILYPSRLYVEHLIFLAKPTCSLLLIQSLELSVLPYFPSQCPSNRPYFMTFTDTMEDWWSTFVSKAFISKTIS